MRNLELYTTIVSSCFSSSGRTRPVEKYNAGSFHEVNPAGSDNKSSRYEMAKQVFFPPFCFEHRISPATYSPDRNNNQSDNLTDT